MDLSERHTNERIAETPEEMEGTVLTDWAPAELRAVPAKTRSVSTIGLNLKWSLTMSSSRCKNKN